MLSSKHQEQLQCFPAMNIKTATVSHPNQPPPSSFSVPDLIAYGGVAVAVIIVMTIFTKTLMESLDKLLR